VPHSFAFLADEWETSQANHFADAQPAYSGFCLSFAGGSFFPGGGLLGLAGAGRCAGFSAGRGAAALFSGFGAGRFGSAGRGAGLAACGAG